MSIAELYHIIDTAPTAYTVVFHAEHAVYQAHFPDKPVTPGACLLQMTEELLQRTLHCPVRVAQVHNLKFTAPLTPEKQVTFSFSPVNDMRYNIIIQDNSTTYAKMSITYMRTHTDV